MNAKIKVSKENAIKKSKVIINQDTKRFRKGQEIELTDEMVKIFTNKGLIGKQTTPSQESEDEKALRLEKEAKAKDELTAQTTLITSVIKANEFITKKDIVIASKLDKKDVDNIVKSLVKDGVLVMDTKNQYSIK